MIRIVTIDDASAITSIYNEYIKNSTATFETKTISTEEMQQRITEISSEFPYLVDEMEKLQDTAMHTNGKKEQLTGIR